MPTFGKNINRDYGKTDDFTKEGMPKVESGNFLYTGKTTRAEIDEIWHALDGFSTYCEFYQQTGYKEAKKRQSRNKNDWIQKT